VIGGAPHPGCLEGGAGIIIEERQPRTVPVDGNVTQELRHPQRTALFFLLLPDENTELILFQSFPER
jgi:hypothetical protein